MEEWRNGGMEEWWNALHSCLWAAALFRARFALAVLRDLTKIARSSAASAANLSSSEPVPMPHRFSSAHHSSHSSDSSMTMQTLAMNSFRDLARHAAR